MGQGSATLHTMGLGAGALKRVRGVMVELYPKVDTARRVVADADIGQGSISFGGSADDVWFSILDEASKQRKLAALVAVALKEYPAYAERLDDAIDGDTDDCLAAGHASVLQGDAAGAVACAAQAG